MTMNVSKRYPISYTTSDELEDYDFSRRVSWSIHSETTLQEAQARVREIIYRYGWNPNKYPQHTRYAFWGIISGDWWGEFRRMMENSPQEKLDVSNPAVVEYRA